MNEKDKKHLAEIYGRGSKSALVVAEICDEILDRSGFLLGEIRTIHRMGYEEKYKKQTK